MMHKVLMAMALLAPLSVTAADAPAKEKPYQPAKVALDSTQFIGNLHLKPDELTKVKAAVEAALKAPIDERQSCGNDPIGCYARTAEDWVAGGTEYREVVVYVHGVGNGRFTFHQVDGKWPPVVVK